MTSQKRFNSAFGHFLRAEGYLLLVLVILELALPQTKETFSAAWIAQCGVFMSSLGVYFQEANHG
jgi:hypothetical protein